MCGIYLCFHNGKEPNTYYHNSLQKRGPNNTSIYSHDKFLIAFYRLAVVGVNNGVQPFIHNNIILVCNGEIYNYKELIKKYNIVCNTNSDCEVILHLYLLLGITETVKLLDGEFAFILIDNHNIYFARDPLGVKPLYIYYNDQNLELSSLISGFSSNTILNNNISNNTTFNQLRSQNHIRHVEPRNIYIFNSTNFSLTTSTYKEFIYYPTHNDYEVIYETFKQAVLKRILQSDENKIGFLLSGGLDSSLVLSIAMEYYSSIKFIPDVFTFGFDENASDVKSAKIMVDFLRKKYGDSCIRWHLVIRNIYEGLITIPNVIKDIETYDTTTIRASTPMYIISEYISKLGIKIVLSGEGSDELFGGYLYFQHAPDKSGFIYEIVKLLNEIYLYDGLRADRSTAAHGLEVRPPFLDRYFIDSVLSHFDLSPNVSNKNYLTKLLLRNVFKNKNYLPDEILWGKKEAFSDAVGLSWKDEIVKYTESLNNIQEFEDKKLTKEMRWYKQLFFKYYNNTNILTKYWLPNQNWINTGYEPSARVLPNY